MKKTTYALALILLISPLYLFTDVPPVNAQEVELLTFPFKLSGNNGAAETYEKIDPNILTGKNKIRLTYDLKGLCVLPGDASAIIFDQNGWRYISLSHYGRNCYDGMQAVGIPLAHFTDLDTTKPVGTFHSRFWYPKSFSVDILSAVLTDSQATTPAPASQPIPTQTPIPNPLATPLTGTGSASGSWTIQSVDAMKETKDAVCGQRDDAWINRWVEKAVEIGANYVAISTPYDSPVCADANAYTRKWVNSIRAHGLKVWFRQMPLAFEGIYSVPKNNSSDFLNLISQYIQNNSDLYQNGDIFTPIPEPQNGGINGITYCAQGVCQFSNAAAFNKWLRDAVTTANLAFQSAGKNGVKIGYFGFDGFVAWGHNNPDWNGILEDSTVSQMGNITIDHYPQAIGTDMAADLKELQARYPGVDIIIGEWGTITGGTDVSRQVQEVFGALKANSAVKGINYWQFGPSGSGEQLINEDFSNRPHFNDVQSFYRLN